MYRVFNTHELIEPHFRLKIIFSGFVYFYIAGAAIGFNERFQITVKSIPDLNLIRSRSEMGKKSTPMLCCPQFLPLPQKQTKAMGDQREG